MVDDGETDNEMVDGETETYHHQEEEEEDEEEKSVSQSTMSSSSHIAPNDGEGDEVRREMRW